MRDVVVELSTMERNCELLISYVGKVLHHNDTTLLILKLWTRGWHPRRWVHRKIQTTSNNGTWNTHCTSPRFKLRLRSLLPGRPKKWRTSNRDVRITRSMAFPLKRPIQFWSHVLILGHVKECITRYIHRFLSRIVLHWQEQLRLLIGHYEHIGGDDEVILASRFLRERLHAPTKSIEWLLSGNSHSTYQAVDHRNSYQVIIS